MARVYLQRGRVPIIIVAPHGHRDDDFNTDVIADTMASELRAYAVINTGWQRAKKAVLGESRANLNDVSHCRLGPCYREFLQPLFSYKEECIKKWNRVNVLFVHGASNDVRHRAKDRVDLVLGFGQGTPPCYTCFLDYKNGLAARLMEERFNVYQAVVGGRYAAWKPDNLTQLWRSQYYDQRVNAIQVEIVHSLRSDRAEAIDTALRMTRAYDRFRHLGNSFAHGLKLKEC